MFTIPRIPCDLNFGLPVLIVLGFIYSIWTFDYFLLFTYPYFDVYDSIMYTYYLFNIVTAVTLYLAFTNCNKKFFNYWYIPKLIESALVIASSIGTSNVLIIPILALGWYIITSVKTGYTATGQQIEPITSFLTQWKQMNEEQPPSYEEAVETKEKETYNKYAGDILRNLGYSKIFELTIVCPGIIFLIITASTNEVGEISYLYVIESVAGVLLCYILYLKFMCNIIPSYKEDLQQIEE